MIKRILFRLLGPEKYLRFVSRMFFFLLKNGFLRNKPEFFNHYMVSKLIREGDHVIDIGANLGYYTVLIAEKAGGGGKVFAVEPVELFRNVLTRNCNGFRSVEILPYALGEMDGKQISMRIPSGHKNFRHGLTHVSEEKVSENEDITFKAIMKHPGGLFGKLARLDYVKCDVEGYEIHILPLMKEIFMNFKPTVQLETGGGNRKKMLAFFKEMGYKVYLTGRDHLYAAVEMEMLHEGDLIFIHEKAIQNYAELIQ